MGNRKGQKHSPESIKQKMVEEHRGGAGLRWLERKYGISRYSISSWCGLRPEVNIRQASPLKRGRPTNRSEDLEKRVKRLEMENELLRNFLQELERK